MGKIRPHPHGTHILDRNAHPHIDNPTRGKSGIRAVTDIKVLMAEYSFSRRDSRGPAVCQTLHLSFDIFKLGFS